MYKELITYCTDTAALIAEAKASNMVFTDDDGVETIEYACIKQVHSKAGKTVAFITVNDVQLAAIKTWTSLKILAEAPLGAEIVMTAANKKLYKGVYNPQPVQVTLEDGTTTTVTPPLLSISAQADHRPLDEIKVSKSDEITKAFQASVQAMISSYVEEEQKTWQVQLEEAKAFTASNTAATPALDELVSASGEVKTDLVTSILFKSDLMSKASCGLLGKKRKLLADIAVATTAQDVLKVAW